MKELKDYTQHEKVLEMERIKYNRRAIDSGVAIYIGRGHRWHKTPHSKWANPHEVEVHGRELAVQLYREYITKGSPFYKKGKLYLGKELLKDLHELQGKKVCCHCEPGELCHGDILIELVDQLI